MHKLSVVGCRHKAVTLPTEDGQMPESYDYAGIKLWLTAKVFHPAFAVVRLGSDWIKPERDQRLFLIRLSEGALNLLLSVGWPKEGCFTLPLLTALIWLLGSISSHKNVV